MARHGCLSACGARRLCLGALGAAVLVVGQLASGLSVGFTAPVSALAASSPSIHPNRPNLSAGTKSVNHLPKPPATPGPKPSYSPPHLPVVPMQAALVGLDPVLGGHFAASDGVLELSAPAGAVTAGDVSAAGGGLNLLVRQVLPASGSNAGGWGEFSFGTWLVQVVDAGGRPASRGLRQPLTVTLHTGSRSSALDLRHTRVLVNQPLPSWVDLSTASVPVRAGPAASIPASGARQQAPASAAPTAKPALGPMSRQAASLDASTSTLSASVALSSPSTTVSFDTDAPVATFGKPDPFETDLSAGALSAGIPLDLPAGPGGLTPPLTLAYNSSGVSDQHNVQGAAPWVGEGWSMGLGAISWAEHNVNSSCGSCGVQWEDSWELSDPYGTAADLVPPDITVKTFNDDTPNAITPSPVTWHTAPETRARVISFGSGLTLPGTSTSPPCFRVFLPSGIMEEFGCTADSLQYYPQPSGPSQGTVFVASWLLDLITDPQGNQVHVTYQRDMETGAGSISYPRDAVMATVEYDSTGCRSATTACTGSSWAPRMRVNFAASHSVAHVSGSSCAANGSLRCDDPVDLSGSGGVAAPTVQGDFVLNDAQVQVRSSGIGEWSALRDYQLGYSQTGPATITDPLSGSQESTAGQLLLTRLQEIGADGATALPARTFGYSTLTQYYEDTLGLPSPTTNCGPSWNNGNTPNGHTGCVLWSQSYAGNSSYLNAVSNGLGLAESFTWQLGRNNFHGVVGGSVADPFACDNGSVQATFPCNMPDDGSWSRAVLTQRTDTVTRLTQAGQGGTQTSTPVASTWNYSYLVPYPIPAPECTLCVATFYWGNQNDFDLLDFYNGRFMGFAQANVSLPDGSLEIHKFLSTEGFGVYDASQVSCDPIDNQHTCTAHNDSWADIGNAGHGHEYELDRYGIDGTTMLQQVKTRWAAACPPSGVSGTPSNPTYGNWDGGLVTELDHSNPVMVCEVHPVQSDTLTYDGASQGPVPDHMTTYTYDSLGRVSSQSSLDTTGLFDASGHGGHAVWSGGVTTGVAGLVSGDSDRALTLDGSTGEIDTGFVQPPVSAYSVEAWVKTTDGGTRKSIVDDRGAGGGQSLTLQLNAGKPTFELESNFLEIGVTGTAAINDGQPHHVVGTWSGSAGSAVAPGQFTLYVDGSAVSMTTVSAGSAVAPLSGLSGTKIGREDAFGTNLAGTVDEVAIYGGALSAARIQAHHTAGSGYQAAILADSPLAYYRLDEGAVGTNPGPTSIKQTSAYVQNDSVTATSNSAAGPYLIDYPAFKDIEDIGGNRYKCAYTSYDGMAWTSGQTSALTLGEQTTSAGFAGCGTPGNNFSDQTGGVSTHHTYDVFGNQVTTTDADASAGVPGHTGCTVSGTAYSACTTYDGAFLALPVSSANALNQVSSTGYPAPYAAPTSIADSSGHGSAATLSDSPVFGSPGLISGNGDTAMELSGAGDALALPGGPFGNYPTSGSTTSYAVTFEAWFQTTAGGVILGQTGGGASPPTTPGGWVPAVYVDTSGALRESLFWHGNTTPNVAAGPYNDGRPHQVVATYSGGVDSLYVDGQLKASQSSASESSYNTGYSYWLGTGYAANWPGVPASAAWYPFSGTIGEASVYSTALSSARVQAHFTAGSGYQSAVGTDSPAAYWRLNDGVAMAADSSGASAHGSVRGPVTLGAGGAPILDGDTTAMAFNNQGYVAVPDNTRWHTPAVSVEAWVYKTADVDWQRVASGGSYPNDNFQLVADNTGKLMFFVFTSGTSNVNVITPSAVPLNTWEHVVGTFDGSTITLYLNGAQVAQSSAAVTMQAGSGGLGIGADANGGNPWNGRLDEVAIYDSALPANRVQAHFSATSNYRSAVRADAPAAYYHLDDTTGPLGGYGLWPTSRTDANGQTTSTGYDALGRVTATTLPRESAGQSTLTTSYTVWCSGAGSQTPCVEIDKTQRLNSTTTATSRAFYDGLGRLVETRSPAPGGQDVVRYSLYDSSQRQVFQSVPYLVAAYAGAPGSAAFSVPDSTVAGNSTTYDGLGRALTSTNALSDQSHSSYSVACTPAGTGGDPGCYEQTLSIDTKGHQGGTLVDALGRTAYAQRYTGSASPYTVYATARYTYDFAGNLVRILEPDGSTQAMFGYDMLGRKTSMSDPDLGAQTYSYDPDGNQTESVDARGPSGTVFMGYDGLDRPIWRNTTNSPTGAYDTYSYDSAAAGNVGIGHLTGETFAMASLSGSESYTYDGRGQQTNTTLTVGGTAYPLGSTYDDAGNVLTQSYPDGETITNGYTAQGWLSQVTTSLGGGTTLASSLAYTGVGGGFGEVTGASLGNGTYTYSASYDLLDRATDLKTTKTSGGAVMFEQQRTFDAAGNVTTSNITMPGATDNQSFCYDEQDRLTWASAATATPPCGGSNTVGTLSSAIYTQSFAYDVMGRLTSGPQGTYAYGDAAHVHASTGIGTAWTAAYDAAGNMTCRAPSGSTTCAGTETGTQLGYNNEGELQGWQSAPSSPTSTAQFLYDGQGQRVEQSVTQSGTTTTTVYVGNLEEVSTTGGTTTTTAYYYAGGKRIGLSVGGTISYLASDGLGSAAVTLNTSGSATASQLYAPYGTLRYSSGTMPTPYGFTGQRADATSGLDYYGARYYDPAAGQFTSADSVLPGGGLDLWGLSRFAYVAGNPENRIDPTGHINLSVGDDSAPVPIQNAFSGTYSFGTGAVTSHAGVTRPYRSAPPPPPPTPYKPRGGDPERNAPGTAPAKSISQARVNGLDIGGLIAYTNPVAYEWVHAEALSDTGIDVIGLAAAFAAIKRRFGWSGDPDQDDLAIYLFAELTDPNTRTAAWGSLISDPNAGSFFTNTGKAPMQTSPGTKMLTGEYINDRGRDGVRVEPWVAYYDQYGRQTVRTDYNAGNLAAGIPSVHHHVYSYGPGGTTSEDHIPGPYTPEEDVP